MSLSTPASAPAPTVPRWLNRIVVWLLRSPAHALMSRTTMLLTFTGRQSGRRYTIPVRYLREGDTLLTTTDSRWWRNLRGGVLVELHLAGQKIAGKADVNTNAEAVEQGIRAILRHMPGDARYYQVHLDRQGQPDLASLKQAAQTNVLVSILIGSQA
ncbi:MAG TPA: nitroreductase/quinone reductase family protein [Ktedonosporobacter sp.]|nr:nitroreductase/quinone reductase family protein [Ktedonosporobacter sp.]